MDDSRILAEFLDNAWEQVSAEILNSDKTDCWPLIIRLAEEAERGEAPVAYPPWRDKIKIR